MLDFIAEQRIAEAIANGDFDDLPGAGKPLELDDDALIPEELRLAYRILKNAGYVPAEAAAPHGIAQLEALVRRELCGAKASASARARRSLSSGRCTRRS